MPRRVGTLPRPRASGLERLFHYRNRGSDCGRAAGIQVRADEQLALRRFLDARGYPRCGESEDPACKLLLCA